MEVKQETANNCISSSPTLDDIYTDICAGINTSDSVMDSNDRATPTGCLPPCLPPWDFSPVPSSLHNSMMHLRPLSSEPRSDEISSPQHSEYYSTVGCHNTLSQSQGYHEWGQMYNWDCFTGYNAQSHKYDISPGLVVGDNSYYKSVTNSVQPTCNTQQYSNDMEFVRCSTPDLITALASLQPDNKDPVHSDNSTPTHDNSNDNKVNCNVSVIQEHGTPAMFMHLAHRYHDSGYNSDLSMSPVYPNNFKATIKSPHDTDEDQPDETNGYFTNEVNLAECVPKFSSLEKTALSMSQSNVLTSLPKLYCLSHKENQIQSSDVSSSQYHLPTLVSKATHRLPPVQPMSLLSHHKYPNKRPTQPQPHDGHAKRKQTSTVTNNMAETPKRQKHSEDTVMDKQCSGHYGNSAMDKAHDKKLRHNQPLNLQATVTMMNWYESNRVNPYPSKVEKERMALEGGITITQVKSWFANKRNRNNNTRPKVQKRQMTERLMNICHELARNAQQPNISHADIIQKLSTIITVPPPEDV